MADTISPIRPYHLWIAWLLLLAFVGVTLYGCLELWRARELVHHGGRGQAVVVDYKVFPPSGRTGTMYLPILRFVDPAGKTWQKDDAQSSNRRLFTVGQSVEVLYPPSQPGDFKTNTWDSVWEFGVVMASLGAVASLLGYGLFVFVRLSLDEPEVGAKWAWMDRYLVPAKLLFRLLGQ